MITQQIKHISTRQLKLNSLAFILVYFLYSLVVYPGHLIGQGPATIIITILTIFPIIIFNLTREVQVDTKKVILFEFVVLVALVFEILLYPDYYSGILDAVVNTLTIGTVGLIVSTFRVDINTCYKYGNYLAILGFFSSIMLPFTMSSEDIFSASMRFAYAILPSVMWALLMFFRMRSLKYLIAFFISYAPMLIWGSRGATVCVLLFIMFYVIKYKPRLLLLFVPLTFLFLLNIQQSLIDIFMWIGDVTGSGKIGSFANLVAGGEEARDKIYDYCIFKMQQNPLGSGVGWWEFDRNMYGLYPHNVILHIGTEFGIFGLVFLLVLVYSGIRCVFLSKNDASLLYMYFFSIGIGRLMVSSTYWCRPEFWFMIGLFLFRARRL